MRMCQLRGQAFYTRNNQKMRGENGTTMPGTVTWTFDNRDNTDGNGTTGDDDDNDGDDNNNDDNGGTGEGATGDDNDDDSNSATGKAVNDGRALRSMTSSQHNNQLTVCHEGGDVLVVERPSVDEKLTRQPHWNVATKSLLHLELSNMRKLVIVVTLVLGG